MLLYPLLYTVVLAFTDASLRPVSHWVGLANFRALLTAEFGGVLARTVSWVAASVALKIGIGLCAALLLNADVPGRGLFRVLVMPPWIVPTAIGAFAWGWMYHGQFGMISGLLQRFGIVDGPVAFLGFPLLAFWATVVTDVWVGVPLVTLYLLAALQSVPADLLDAARVDGARRWRRFRHIVLPFLAPALGGMAVLSAIFTVRSFDVIWILTAGGPGNATDTVVIDLYRTAFARYRYGEGAARTLAMGAVLSVLVVLYLWMLGRDQARELAT